MEGLSVFSHICLGPLKGYGMPFSGNWTPTHPIVTLIMLNLTSSYHVFPENLTLPHLRYVTLEWPLYICDHALPNECCWNFLTCFMYDLYRSDSTLHR